MELLSSHLAARRSGRWGNPCSLPLTRGTQRDPAKLVELKTPGCARRDVVLLPDLADLLREHRRQPFRMGVAREDAFVFSTRNGTPLNYRNVAQRGLTAAADRSGLTETASRPHTPRPATHVRLASRAQRGRRRDRVASDGARAAKHHVGRLFARVRRRSTPRQYRIKTDPRFQRDGGRRRRPSVSGDSSLPVK